jgi:hypothetical protein
LQPVLRRSKLGRTSILREFGGADIHPIDKVNKPFRASNQYVSHRIYKFYYGKECLISLQSQYEKSETIGPFGTDHVAIELENVKRNYEVRCGGNGDSNIQYFEGNE